MAATDILTDKAIKAALKAATEAGKARRISDGGGLYLEARPTGAGWWRLRYWLDSRESMLSLGTYPETGLRDARVRRDEARKQIASGIDPSETRKAEKAERKTKREAQDLADAGMPAAGTFEHVGREWLAHVHEVKVSAGRFDLADRSPAEPWEGVLLKANARPLGVPGADLDLVHLRQPLAPNLLESANARQSSIGQLLRLALRLALGLRDFSRMARVDA